ncbi:MULTISPECIES: 2-hydroxyacid dehydrogenase [unclassified Chelatococcus]|uniref:2-hydroxyacid dehydrogenase n=1 Tax=unclassified Chelatococcus TaxID=2638111 RepID=UPI001BCDA576|nr:MULTISPECIES: 2-hydroxyacid dehydrogenase [unclassified Chelatococcus]MBS7698707.1 phosphoglycerate dehydrogenase [Chelatococcus sp. YT9]MBX3554711.1 phosphoglycerate dehydrogenase [Chelatococcus sp.]
MRIVFHGENAASFSHGFADLVGPADIAVLPDVLASEADRATYAAADVVVGTRYNSSLPRPEGLKLFHVPGAGYDAVDLTLLPASATVCNCFGHEQAIAEYVMAGILARHVPLADADAKLRNKDWSYWAGAPERVHDELAEKTIGLLGFGHIGKAIAARAKAFEMKVHVANRSPVPTSALVDRSFPLDRLDEFWGSADFIVVSVPLTDETTGIVSDDAFDAMRPSAVVFNVGRGPTIDERALYEALRDNKIAGAVIDTWYVYPSPDKSAVLPSILPFHELPNIVMTPHMSGWTSGTIRRRQKTIADNVLSRAAGRPCTNVVREGGES